MPNAADQPAAQLHLVHMKSARSYGLFAPL